MNGSRRRAGPRWAGTPARAHRCRSAGRANRSGRSACRPTVDQVLARGRESGDGGRGHFRNARPNFCDTCEKHLEFVNYLALQRTPALPGNHKFAPTCKLSVRSLVMFSASDYRQAGTAGRAPPLKGHCLRGRLVVGPQRSCMPFLSPSAARVPPLSFLLADQIEPPQLIARHLGVSLRTLQRYVATGNAPRGCTWPCGSRAAGGSAPCTRRP